MKIQIDYSHCMASNIGYKNGVPEELLALPENFLSGALPALARKRDSGELGFLNLHASTNTEEIKEFVSKTVKDLTDVVVVGIGGSSLGNRALHEALNLPGSGPPKIHVCDNIDPDSISALLSEISSLKTTQFQIITKSGSTAETLANFMIFHELLKKEKLAPATHLVAITDPEKGDLLKLARKEGIPTFSVPPNVGGRFSVLTPVGLLSAAYSGIRIREILDGAQEMSQRCWNKELLRNPAAILAFLMTYLGDSRGKSDVIFMPYSSRLRSFALWFCQLWAESLGKQGQGQTPVAVEGAADQHSQLQLYMEGPENKLILFLKVEQPVTDYGLESALSADSIDYLKGKTLNELFVAEQLATATTLARSGRPNLTISIDRIEERNVGALIFLFEFATALAGEIRQINAFDQPGVEEGKRLTYAMMGRPGYEQKKQELSDWQQNLKLFQCS
jgi:glucose-6-phosphate isomerase